MACCCPQKKDEKLNLLMLSDSIPAGAKFLLNMPRNYSSAGRCVLTTQNTSRPESSPCGNFLPLKV